MSSGRPSTSAPQRGGTPKLGTSTPRTASSTSATNGTSNGTTRPGSNVPRPGSTLPNKQLTNPGQGQVPVKQQQQQAEVPTTIMNAGTPMNIDQRGKKREREDGNVNGIVNGVLPHSGVLPTGQPAPPPPHALTTNGYGNGVGPPKLTVNARAGTAGIRPRPIKKQKMVSCSSILSLWDCFACCERLISRTFFLYLGYARTGEGCCSTCATTNAARRLIFFSLFG